MLPLLRRLANAMSNKEYVYLFVCQIVIVGVIPIIEYLISRGTVRLNPKFSATLFTQWNIFYVLMGYYIEKRLDKKYFNKRNVCIGLVASFIAISISCLMAHYYIQVTGIDKESQFVFHNNLLSIPTVTVYFTCKYIFEKVKLSSSKVNIIRFVVGTTFGIYLIEEILRERTLFIFNYLKPVLHTLPATIIWIACACILGCIIVAVLKKIPGIKKYL